MKVRGTYTFIDVLYICARKISITVMTLVRVLTPQSYLVFRNEEAIRASVVMGMSRVEYTEPT
jgi:hypothetical protein